MRGDAGSAKSTALCRSVQHEDVPVSLRTLSTVLVVEDEPLILLGACDLVERAGFHAMEALDADRALAILEANSHIAMVFTDIDMPGSMDGLVLAAIIAERWPQIALIVASGRRMPASCAMPRDAVYFAKPYVEADVMAVMQRMIS